MVRLPAGRARATRCKRVWLTEEEEAGYYYGFANEGLWPLCHIVHARPHLPARGLGAVPRPSTRSSRTRCSRRSPRRTTPVVLIQDYHFALLPAPHQGDAPRRARRALLAHPVAELRGVRHLPLAGRRSSTACSAPTSSASTPSSTATTSWRRWTGPSRRRIDWEHFSVARGQHVTLREAVPHQRGPPSSSTSRPPRAGPRSSRSSASTSSSSAWAWSASTTRRGCPERFARDPALLRALTPSTAGASTFVQLAAPSRSRIPRYQALEEEVDAARRRRSTASSASGGWRPIVYLKRHHDHRDVWPFYRCGGLLHGDLAPRRHEPGGQGVRVGPRGRRRRAHPEPVHRRRPGAARRAARQPLRRRRDGRGDPAAPSRCPPASGGAAWRGCARRCASTTSTAGPASCSASWRACPARRTAPTDGRPGSAPGACLAPPCDSG